MTTYDVQRMQKIVDLAVGIDRFSYPANVNAPRPEGEYATVKELEDRPVGTPQIDWVEDTPTGSLLQVLTQLRIVVFDVLFSRNGEEASNFANSPFRYDIVELFTASGLVLMHIRSLDNRTVDLETNWEARAGIRVYCNVLRRTQVRAGIIEEVIITNSNFNIDGINIPVSPIRVP